MASIIAAAESSGAGKDRDEDVNVIDPEDAHATIAGLDSKTYNKLMPTGRAIARIFDDAKRAEEAPEEVPVYYWDEDFEGDPEELGSKEKVWHNVHSMGYRTFKGMEFLGEIFANFFGLTKSRYQWVIDAKEKEKAEKERALLEHRQRQWLLQQRKLRREKEFAEKMAAEALAEADKLEGGE